MSKGLDIISFGHGMESFFNEFHPGLCLEFFETRLATSGINLKYYFVDIKFLSSEMSEPSGNEKLEKSRQSARECRARKKLRLDFKL